MKLSSDKFGWFSRLVFVIIAIATALNSVLAVENTVNISKMPTYIVTMEKDAPAEELEKAKQKVKDSGGNITHEYKLFKGFAAEIPEGVVTELNSDEKVENVELDQEVRTFPYPIKKYITNMIIKILSKSEDRRITK